MNEFDGQFSKKNEDEKWKEKEWFSTTTKNFEIFIQYLNLRI